MCLYNTLRYTVFQLKHMHLCDSRKLTLTCKHKYFTAISIFTSKCFLSYDCVMCGNGGVWVCFISCVLKFSLLLV